jgi:serine/threonine protein kinase
MELTFDLPDEDDDDMLLSPGGASLPMGGGGASALSSELREGDVLRGQGGGEYAVTSQIPIGSGTSGKVYSGSVTASGMTVAIKVIDRMEIDGRPDKIKQLTRELNITRKLKHPNIINLLDIVFDDMRAMLIMEMADGGMLFDLVSAGTPLPEERARYLFKQMVSAMSYCHDKQIYHRDLKLENVMLTSDGTDVLKIADFGASKDASINSLPKTQVGTISYMAPEVTNVNKKESESSYGAGADIWSLGVILYVLVCCKYPFGFDGPKRHGGIQAHKVYENIRKGADAVDFPESISPELVELLRGIFTVKVPSPEQAASADAGGSAVAVDEPVRWTLTQIRESAWLQVGDHYAPTVVEEELIAEIFWCVRCRGAAALHVPCACSCDS